MTVNAKLQLSATDKTRRAFKSVQASLKGITRQLTGVQAQIGAVIGVAGFGGLVAVSNKSIDALAKNSDKLGIATEKLAELHHITSLYTSAGAPAMTEALTKATKRLGEFNQTGGGAAARWLQQLNLDTERLAQLAPDQLFNAYAESIRGLNDRGEQLAAISALMGDESRALIGIIDQMPETLEAGAREARALGLAINRIDAAKVEAANDSFTKVRGVVSGFGNQLSVEVAPFLEAMANSFADMTIEAGGFGAVAANLIDGLLAGIGFVADAFRGWQLIWAGLKVSYAGLISFVVNGLNDIQEAIVGVINKIPGIDIAPFQGLQQIAVETQGTFLDAQVALADLVMTPMPSEQFAQWSEEVRARAQAAAEQVAAVRAAAIAPVGVGEGGEDGSSFKLSSVMTDAEFEAEFARAEEQFAMLDELYRSNQQHFTEIWKQGLDERQKFQQLSGAEQVKQVSADFAAIVKGATQSNKTLFKINKVAGIANAVISTAEGVTKTLSAYPFPINVAMAAGSLAAGIAQINTIKSTQFGGGGSVPSVGAGAGAVPRVPDTLTPGADTQFGERAVPVRGTVGTINIVVNGVLTPEIVDDTLIPMIRDGIDNRDVILIDSNSRQAQELIA